MDTKERALIGFHWCHEAIAWFEHTLKFNSKYRASLESKATALRAQRRMAEPEDAQRRAKELGG